MSWLYEWVNRVTINKTWYKRTLIKRTNEECLYLRRRALHIIKNTPISGEGWGSLGYIGWLGRGGGGFWCRSIGGGDGS